MTHLADCGKKGEKRGKRMNDLISRQAAIDALAEWHDVAITNRLNNLPSAQQGQRNAIVFQGIIVEYPSISAYPEYEGKPYFSIKYTENGQEFIGYGTYKPEVLSEYLKKYFMPSAQPEQRWIPCSERLPDEHEWLGTKKFGTTISNEVYVTFEAPDGQRFAKHISFQNGKLSPVDEQRMKVWFKGAKPIAWMPLPEPYREERTEE